MATLGKWTKNALKFSDNAFYSENGLILGFGSKHKTRLLHFLEHAKDNLDKDLHGVFTLGDEFRSLLVSRRHVGDSEGEGFGGKGVKNISQKT